MEGNIVSAFCIDYARNHHHSDIIKKFYSEETWTDVIKRYEKIKEIIQTISFEDVKFVQFIEIDNLVCRNLISCDQSVLPEEVLKRTFKILLSFYRLYDSMINLGIEVKCSKGIVHVFLNPLGYFITNNFPSIIFHICNCNTNNNVWKDLSSMTEEYKNPDYTSLKRIELFEKAFQYMCKNFP